jgi:hypothetical protein
MAPAAAALQQLHKMKPVVSAVGTFVWWETAPHISAVYLPALPACFRLLLSPASTTSSLAINMRL